MGLYRDDTGFYKAWEYITAPMEDQIAQKMENKNETTLYMGLSATGVCRTCNLPALEATKSGHSLIQASPETQVPKFAETATWRSN